jgi:hypothetical protein
MRGLRSICVALMAVAFVLTGCSSDAGPGGGAPTTAPTPAPTTTEELFLAGEEVLECLDGHGIDVEAEEDPRFGSDTEIQVGFQTSSGIVNVGVFVYDSVESADAGKEELDAALEGFGSPPSSQVGNVLLSGLQQVISEVPAQETLDALLDCLGGFTPPGA